MTTTSGDKPFLSAEAQRAKVEGLSSLSNAQADLVGVPQDAEGIDLVALDASVTRLKREGRHGATTW